jgi:hypothetical protein
MKTNMIQFVKKRKIKKIRTKCLNNIYILKNLFHSLGLVYKSMSGMMTNSIDRNQWLNVTSESRDRI